MVSSREEILPREADFLLVGFLPDRKVDLEKRGIVSLSSLYWFVYMSQKDTIATNSDHTLLHMVLSWLFWRCWLSFCSAYQQEVLLCQLFLMRTGVMLMYVQEPICFGGCMDVLIHWETLNLLLCGYRLACIPCSQTN